MADMPKNLCVIEILNRGIMAKNESWRVSGWVCVMSFFFIDVKISYACLCWRMFFAWFTLSMVQRSQNRIRMLTMRNCRIFRWKTAFASELWGVARQNGTNWTVVEFYQFRMRKSIEILGVDHKIFTTKIHAEIFLHIFFSLHDEIHLRGTVPAPCPLARKISYHLHK